MTRKSKGVHDVVLRSFEKAIAATFIGNVYTAFFRQMTVNEFQMADIRPGHRILHVGCGSVPNTLLILAEAYEASYVGLDRDPTAVARARSMVRRYGLDAQVAIKEGDALSVDYAGFDIIVLSLGVEPREDILAAMRNGMDSRAKVVARKPWDFMDRLYGREEFIPHGFRIVDTFHRPDFIKSMLLEPVERQG
ncbi:MAG: class I SAM-dependent methyltransferase [Thermoplasmatota archaeon]